MPDTWLILPSANPTLAKQSLPRWKKLGYRILILGEDDYGIADDILFVTNKQYRGTPWAFNELMDHVRTLYDAKLIAVTCDDVFPDENFTASEMHERYLGHWPNYEGIVEPSKGKVGHEHHLVVGPLVGYNYYEKHGYHEESYNHFFCDQDFYHKTKLLGLLKIDDEIEYNHRHWTRNGGTRPKHMARWKDLHEEDRKNFMRRSQDGFR